MSIHNFSVASYNILSQSLVHYCKVEPRFLDERSRWDRVEQTLDSMTNQNKIIGLQEVTQSWCGKLHSFFQQRDYHVIHRLNSLSGQGYMGILLAIPNKTYLIEDVLIQKVVDSKSWSKQSQSYMGWLMSYIRAPVDRLIGLFYKKEVDLWDYVQGAHHNVICARIRDRTRFVVATYHAPCVFWLKYATLIHTSLVNQVVNRFADGLPTVLMGDFNFKPDSPSYKLMTEGLVDNDQQPRYRDSWRITALPMSSAYTLSKLGGEPLYTNRSITDRGGIFSDTIDYIFLKGKIAVRNCISLPEANSSFFPDAIEPSDHLPIGADLCILDPHGK